ncbi:hypothetical protein GGR52DRAFT_328653 [Hypoxylon sp. FL1284]|nr:hypothetical protein GGR52DRAFT_328653 [Hypoxylon sp. FL1284]
MLALVAADLMQNCPPSQVIYRIIHFDFIRNVSPGLALGSCLVLGCCLSSYTHRRRDQDQYQAIVFAGDRAVGVVRGHVQQLHRTCRDSAVFDKRETWLRQRQDGNDR